MDDTFPRRPTGHERRATPLKAIAGAMAGAFLLGAVGVWYLLQPEGSTPADMLGLRSGPAAEETAAPAPAAPDEAPAAQTLGIVSDAARTVEDVAEQQGGLDQRIAAMEQRLARLDLQAQAAAGNAARAEGLLIVFASRRAIERGAQLGYLADQLQLRFGDARPNSVTTVIAGSRDPVTIDQLLARLDGLAPQLQQSPADEDAVGWLNRQMRELFVVRRRDTPSPAAERRLERARLFLESGRAGAAASEIRNLPNAAGAADWIADAERYARVQRSLELLELTAILEPRELRDRTGTRVEQPAPTDPQ